MDGSFQFGDVGVLLNLNPRSKSIADLIPELDAGELDSIDTFLIDHIVRHPRPPRPADARDGRDDHRGRRQEGPRVAAHEPRSRRRGLHRVLQRHDAGHPRFGRCDPDDAQSRNHEHQEHAPLPRGRRAARLRERARCGSSSTAPIRRSGIRVADVEHSIGRKVDETIVSDGRSVVYAFNRGVPFFLSNREAQVSQDILRLARSVVGERTSKAERRRQPEGDAEEIVVRMALSTGTVSPSGREGV